MIFGSAPQLVFYLTSKELVLFLDPSQDPVVLSFPPELVSYQEVVNSEDFKAYCQEFLSQIPIKNPTAMMVLSPELLFQQTFPMDDPTSQDQMNMFIDALPFEPQQVAVVQLQSGPEMLVIGANKELFSLIQEVFQSLNGRLTSVVPSTLFGEMGPNGPSSADEMYRLVGGKIPQNANFLMVLPMSQKGDPNAPAVVEQEESVDEDEEESVVKKYLLLGLGLAMIGVGVGIILVYLSIIKNPFAKPKPAASVPPSAVASASAELTPGVTVEVATSSATPESTISGTLSDKALVKINVINGAGVPGQANRVKSQLLGLGYKNIDTSSGSGSATVTVVTTNSKPSKAIMDEIVKTLDASFKAVATKIDPKTTPDISIIIGTLK
jgi:hypothetical protein